MSARHDMFCRRNGKPCSACRGAGSDFERECRDCEGSGYDPTPDHPFGQCHTCFGEGVVTVEECLVCGGTGLANG